MPYTTILDKTFIEVRDTIKEAEVVDSIAKRIIFNSEKNPEIDTFQSDSSVIIHFDILTGELLLIDERFDFSEELFESVNEAVEAFNDSSEVYDSWLQLSDTDDYYDILTGRKNVIEELKRQDEEGR